MQSTPVPLYTIGYGDRSLEEFAAVLARYGIQYLIDVRTAPYSRFKPEFNKAALEQSLTAQGIRYIYMGDTLGGRPEDPACYSDGKVDYEQIKLQPWYQAGLARLGKAYRQQVRAVLMCSEGKPEACHRSKLIGASLTEEQIPIQHIDEAGELQSQEEVILALTGGQLGLFGDPTFTSRKRYQAGNSTTQNPDTDEYPEEDE
jgi:uncharacterized protein (DUF488 family)